MSKGENRGLKVKKIRRGKHYPSSYPLTTSSLSKLITMEELNTGDKEISSPFYPVPPRWVELHMGVNTTLSTPPPPSPPRLEFKEGDLDWCLYGQRDRELLQNMTRPGGLHSSTSTPGISYPKCQGCNGIIYKHNRWILRHTDIHPVPEHIKYSFGSYMGSTGIMYNRFEKQAGESNTSRELKGLWNRDRKSQSMEDTREWVQPDWESRLYWRHSVRSVCTHWPEVWPWDEHERV